MSIIRDHARIGACRFQPTQALSCLFLAVLFLAVASFSAASATAPPAAATLLTPADGATLERGNPPQLSWAQGQPTADWFYIYLNRNASHYLDFWQVANTYSATNNWTTNLPAGTYTWWVRTWNSGGNGPWSPGRTFTVLGAPGRITAISPQGTIESTPSITYAWYIADIYTVWYELYIMKNGALYSDTWHHVAPGDLETSDGGQFGECSLTLKNQPSGTNNWWVRGWSPDGMGAWSATMTFTNRLIPSGTVTLMAPANNAVVSNALPECSWQNNGGATWNWLLLYRSNSLYCSEWLEAKTTWTPTNTLPVGNYTLWLVGWNPDGYGTWTSGSFSVPVRVPGSMMLLSPTGVMCDNSPMEYSWTADPNTAWYQLIIIKNSNTLANRWYPASASTSSDPSQFDIQVPEQHGAGNYTWWLRGWSADGYGPWCSTNFTIYDQSAVLPLAGSSWIGHFSTSSTNWAKTHVFNNLTFNTNGTFTGSGSYQVLILPNTLTLTNESYTGTCTIDENAGAITANGTAYWNGSPQGSISFMFSFDATHQHITSGIWTDTWDSSQEFDIYPDNGSPYVTYINRICGTH